MTFRHLYDKMRLPELVATVRRAVASHFRQRPNDIVLGFSLGKSDSGATAQLGEDER
jgi:hypothetical protein